MKGQRLRIEQEKMRQRKQRGSSPEPVESVAPNAHQPIEQEQHFNTAQIAKLWGISPWTVRRLFSNKPGVLKISLGEKKKARTLLIPARVLRAVHEQMSTA